MKNKLVLNFSTLNLWSKGYIDAAIECFFRRGVQTKAMEEGSMFHKKWETEIKKTKQLKIGKTVIRFEHPECETFITTYFNNLFDIKGTMDCIDGSILYEFKSGKTKGLDFAGTMQIPVYFLINEMVGNHLEKAILLHYDQHSDKTEYIVVWNDKVKMDGARNWIETLGNELYQYFTEHQIPFDNSKK